MSNTPDPENMYAPPQINTRTQKGPSGGPRGGKPENYLVHSIIATLCCCVPFGIVSIVFASQVDSKWNQGDFVGAKQASEKAKFWFWLAVGLGLVANLLVFGLQFAIAANGGI